MNRRRFLSTISAAALLAALPLPVVMVMGRAAKTAQWTFYYRMSGEKLWKIGTGALDGGAIFTPTTPLTVDTWHQLEFRFLRTQPNPPTAHPRTNHPPPAAPAC